MAKLEYTLTGDFNAFLEIMHREILRRSPTASYEDGSDLDLGDVKVAVRVYERYSVMGGNRVSLAVTAVERGGTIYLSAVAAGGSQAMLLKVNTLGEHSFVELLREIVTEFERA